MIYMPESPTLGIVLPEVNEMAPTLFNKRTELCSVALVRTREQEASFTLQGTL